MSDDVYLHQASAGAPIVKMSAKTVKINGVTYKPRWAWSDWYRQQFRQSYSLGKGRLSRHVLTKDYLILPQMGNP
jgi:hypothetical protein